MFNRNGLRRGLLGAGTCLDHGLESGASLWSEAYGNLDAKWNGPLRPILTGHQKLLCVQAYHCPERSEKTWKEFDRWGHTAVVAWQRQTLCRKRFVVQFSPIAGETKSRARRKQVVPSLWQTKAGAAPLPPSRLPRRHRLDNIQEQRLERLTNHTLTNKPGETQ